MGWIGAGDDWRGVVWLQLVVSMTTPRGCCKSHGANMTTSISHIRMFMKTEHKQGVKSC